MAFINRSEMIDPFVEVKIGPPGAKASQMITLPTWITKLIHNFEYSLTRDGGQSSATRIQLQFLETLNKPGSLLDLRLDNDSLVFMDAKTVKEGKQDEKDVQATLQDDKEISSIEKQNSDKKEKEIKEKIKKVKPRFLFQEQNTIQVTFGYRNSKTFLLSSKTVYSSILQITHKASENGIPVTEICGVDIGSNELSKIYPRQGYNFSVKRTKELLNGTLKDPSNRGDTAPARIDDIVTAIATGILENTEVNLDFTDDELTKDIQDKHSSRTWAMGTNLHSFLKKLAEKLSCHYYMETIIKDGKTKHVINIVSRLKYESTSKFHFMWKSGQGNSGTQLNANNTLVFNTIKSYELQLYPMGGSGGSSTGVDSGNKKIDAASDPVSIGLRASGLGPVDSVLNHVEKLKTAEDLAGKMANTAAGVYSGTNDNENHKANADRLALRQGANLRLSFSTVGIPQLEPQTIVLSNIGERYSGTYYLLSVTHSINAQNGYTCSVVGEGHSVNSGGVKVPVPPVKQDTTITGTLTLKHEAGEKPVDVGTTFIPDKN